MWGFEGLWDRTWLQGHNGYGQTKIFGAQNSGLAVQKCTSFSPCAYLSPTFCRVCLGSWRLLPLGPLRQSTGTEDTQRDGVRVIIDDKRTLKTTARAGRPWNISKERWISSAINKYTDLLSRTWKPDNMMA